MEALETKSALQGNGYSPTQLKLSVAGLSSLNGGYSEEEALQISLEGGDPFQSSSGITIPSQYHRSECTTICTGTTSQYSSGRGSSACTSICLVGACQLLNCEDLHSIESSDLDGIVQEGIRRHAEIGVGHTGVDDLWDLPQFVDIQSSLQRHESLQGYLRPSSSDENGFLAVLGSALENVDESHVSILLTKSPETVLCLFVPGGVYLFDSHGESDEAEKRVALKQFDSVRSLVGALQQKYPAQDFGEENSIMGDLYNTFEVTPLTLRRSVTVSNINDAAVRQAIQLSLENGSTPAVDPLQNANTSIAMPLSPPPTDIVGLFERDDYEDPISKEIMADPVKCADGFTYERQNIERHFRIQVEAEEERQAELQADNPRVEQDTTRCGARRRIDLTSPITGEVVSDTLLPDRNLERTIVRLVERNALGMTDEEIRDWIELREEKRIQDRAREEETRAARANQLRMAEQAARAEERRQAERNNLAASEEIVVDIVPNQEATLPDAQVRVERNIRIDTERLSENDLGLSVSLCEHGDRIFPDYILATSQQLRCMVTCCAAPMDPDTPNWCTRCGRIVCPECLKFDVTDIAVQKDTSLHSICSDCVTHVVDGMDQSNLLSRQTRDIIRVINLQRDSARLINAAAVTQDHVVRHDTNESHQARLHAFQTEIETLQRQRHALELQIERAKGDAQHVREDDNVGDDLAEDGRSCHREEIEILQERYRALEQELSGITESNVPDEEELQIQHVIRREEISIELEQVQMQLAEALSEHYDSASLDRKDQSFAAARPPDDESFVTFVELVDQVEREIKRTTAKPIEGARSERGAIAGEDSGPGALSVLLNAIEQHDRRRFGRKSRRSHFRRLQELVSNIHQREQDEAVNTAEYRQQLDELKEALDQVPRHWSKVFDSEIRAARADLAQRESESTSVTVDPIQELLQLQTVDVSSLNEDEQIQHVIRISHLHESMKRLEEVLLSSFEGSNDTGSVPKGAHDNDLGSVTNVSRQETSEAKVERPVSGTVDPNEQVAAPQIVTTAPSVPLEPVTRVVDSESGLESTKPTSGISSLIRGVGGLMMSYFTSSSSARSDETPVDLNECRARLAAIGNQNIEWTLPLGLEYPTRTMTEQVEILRNSLELRHIDSQRHWEQELSQVEDSLMQEIQKLENTVQELTAQANNAEASVAQARADLEERRRQRALERRRQQERRRQEELRRQEQERRAQAEAEALRERQEEQTRRAFAAAQGGQNQATTFGGRGDLRMCRRCKAGPIENQACSDLASHNGRSRANHCPNCDWHDPNWHNWPYFDGIYGPH